MTNIEIIEKHFEEFNIMVEEIAKEIGITNEQAIEFMHIFNDKAKKLYDKYRSEINDNKDSN